MRALRGVGTLLIVVLAIGLAPLPADASNLRDRFRDMIRELQEKRQDRPELHSEQVRSLSQVYDRARD